MYTVPVAAEEADPIEVESFAMMAVEVRVRPAVTIERAILKLNPVMA